MLLGIAHAAQRELKEVRVAYPPSMASVTLMTGIKQKFFEEQGLNPTLLVIANALDMISAHYPQAKQTDPSLIVDPSFVRRIDQSGFIRALYKK